MPKRKIIQPDNPVLRQKARRVREFDKNLHKLLDDMIETMHDADGVGLAAPQIAVSQRIIVVELPDDPEDDRFGEQAGVFYEVINPEIIKASNEEVEGVEACLSIPGYFGTVDRKTSIVVRGADRNGKEIRIKAYDWLARVFQHEIDHLDGVLFIDKANDVWQAGEEPPQHLVEDEEDTPPDDEDEAKSA